jgi:hypothetical protein
MDAHAVESVLYRAPYGGGIALQIILVRHDWFLIIPRTGGSEEYVEREN